MLNICKCWSYALWKECSKRRAYVLGEYPQGGKLRNYDSCHLTLVPLFHAWFPFVPSSLVAQVVCGQRKCRLFHKVPSPTPPSTLRSKQLLGDSKQHSRGSHLEKLRPVFSRGRFSHHVPCRMNVASIQRRAAGILLSREEGTGRRLHKDRAWGDDHPGFQSQFQYLLGQISQALCTHLLTYRTEGRIQAIWDGYEYSIS